MRRLKAVLFDMDGLMFDTERLATRFWKQAGEEAGLKIGEEFLVYSRGCRREESEKLFKRCYPDRDDFMELRRREKELLASYIETHEIPVKQGLFELLKYLKEQDYRVILATSTIRPTALRYLESAGVRKYFDDLVCGDMIQRSKPDPDIFLKAAAAAGCRVDECVVLEDSMNGIHAALAGGFTAVMVPDLVQPDEELEKKLSAKCGSLLEVIGFLKAEEKNLKREAEEGKSLKKDKG